MAQINFMDKLRSFLGLRQEPPRNDFRNPIWGDDDDDDVDELYSKHNNMEVFDPLDIHSEITKHMQDMFKSFGSIFGDMRTFFSEDLVDSFTSTDSLPIESEESNSNNIRDYYLKPGYQNSNNRYGFEDVNLDGQISSSDISGLLKKKDEHDLSLGSHFDNRAMVPHPFCQTVITTRITKSDGTTETRRIIKKGNKVIEETTTTLDPDLKNTSGPGLSSFAPTGFILSELSSLFRNFY